MRLPRMLSAVLFALALAAARAHAIIRLPGIPAQVAGNPAERLLSMPIEDPVYDPATRCSRKPRPGTCRRWRAGWAWRR